VFQRSTHLQELNLLFLFNDSKAIAEDIKMFGGIPTLGFRLKAYICGRREFFSVVMHKCKFRAVFQYLKKCSSLLKPTKLLFADPNNQLV